MCIVYLRVDLKLGLSSSSPTNEGSKPRQKMKKVREKMGPKKTVEGRSKVLPDEAPADGKAED